jgi:hypothetical protein
MKKISLLLISLFVSLGAHSEWTNVLPGNNASLYIDFETLEEKDGFIYWWYMDTWSTGSEKTYAQGDCNLMGFKVNKRSRFPFPMGEGEGVEKEVVSAWEYYAPNSGFDVLLSFICEMSRLSAEEKAERIEVLNKRNEEFERQRNEALNLETSPQVSNNNSTYIKAINSKIKSFWKFDGAGANWSCNVLISQAKNGAIEGVKILGCDTVSDEDLSNAKSKTLAFGNSIRRAVFKSSPLPLPEDEIEFKNDLIIRFFANK